MTPSENQSKGRKFLKPLSVAVATLLATAGADAMASSNIHAALNKAHQVIIEQSETQNQPAPLVIKPAQNEVIQIAEHYSHSSHSSHSSHYSSRW
jgi:hypothetical protein